MYCGIIAVFLLLWYIDFDVCEVGNGGCEQIRNNIYGIALNAYEFNGCIQMQW